MFTNQVLRDQRPQNVVVEQIDRVQLVGCAEAVEEMHERYPGPQRGRLCDQGQVVGLLHGAGRQQRKAGLAHRHHVLMVAEDREPLRGKGSGGDMDHRGG